MTPRYPCPNPICTHEFDPQELAGVDSVTCPLCGMTIQLRAAPAPAPAPPPTATIPSGIVPTGAVPMARPARAVPMARPVPTASTVPSVAPQQAVRADVPLQAPTAAMTANEFTAPVVRKKAVPRFARDWLTYTLVLGGFGLLVAFGIVGAIVGFGTFNKKGGLGSGSGYKNTDYNFAFDPKTLGWEENSGMKNKLGVSQLVISRANPGGYLALDVVDYKDHNPTPRELDSEARRRLNEAFKSPETNPPASANPKIGPTLAGQPAYQIEFEAPQDEVTGEVQFFGSQGLGYWVYTWAPSAAWKELAGQFAEMKKTFVLLGERAAWKQTQSQRTIFESSKVKGVRLADTTGRWKVEEDFEAQDPNAVLALYARDPSRPKLATLGAEVTVMVIPGGKDAVEAAKEHIQKKHEREGYPGTKILDGFAEGDGPKESVGEAKGRLVLWRINNGGGRERFAVVGVVPRGDELLIVYGECDYARRASWEAQLVQIVESLQVKE